MLSSVNSLLEVVIHDPSQAGVLLYLNILPETSAPYSVTISSLLQLLNYNQGCDEL